MSVQHVLVCIPTRSLASDMPTVKQLSRLVAKHDFAITEYVEKQAGYSCGLQQTFTVHCYCLDHKQQFMRHDVADIKYIKDARNFYRFYRLI